MPVICLASLFMFLIFMTLMARSSLLPNTKQKLYMAPFIEAIPMYVEELLLLLTCYVEGTS